MEAFMRDLRECLPSGPSGKIPWDKVMDLMRMTCFGKLGETLQDPRFHGEGDVLAHTRMVCEELCAMPAFWEREVRQRMELFLAALLHDIGKARTTRLEDGAWISPYHSVTGSLIVRGFLWREGLCGSPDAMALRESVCSLVRYHMLPVHLIGQTDPVRRARVVGALGELAGDFTWELLCLLAEADVRGRIARDMEEELLKVQLSRLTAEEAGCLSGPYPFQSPVTKHAYLTGRGVQPDQELYDETWGEVVMLSGLPGTGKDTWARENLGDLPIVSLDEIRQELKISPTQGQGPVIALAQERAKEMLRKKQPFIWNATDLTRELRQRPLSLFERYGARVRIVYLETQAQKRRQRNAARERTVPEGAVERMLDETVPPTPEEARRVEWICV